MVVEVQDQVFIEICCYDQDTDKFTITFLVVIKQHSPLLCFW